MPKLSKKKRKELIGQIMEDIQANLYNYEDFVLDCAESVVSKWSDEELLDWVGKDIAYVKLRK